jgi:4'-phosphopantetheinyl transferase EntD
MPVQPLSCDESPSFLAQVKGLLPPGAVTALRRTRLAPQDSPLLGFRERRVIEAAVPRRRQEFVAGRQAAHDCLEQLGQHARALAPDANRAPEWPPGTTGSISHSNDLCLAVAALRTSVDSIGLDIETASSLSRELWPLVLTRPELLWLEELAEPERIGWATLLFSAKESVYKCQYQRTRAYVDFQEVSVHIDAAARTFHVSFDRPVLDRPVRGRFARSGGYVVTLGFVVPESSRASSSSSTAAAVRTKSSSRILM